MKRFFQLLLITMFCSALLVGQDKKKQNEVTIKGEVIDSKCYIGGGMGPGYGQDHKECALKCAKGGIPLAVLEDGTNNVYFVAKLRGTSGPNDMLIPFIAEKVIVKGRLAEKGGAKLLLIDTVEKAQ